MSDKIVSSLTDDEEEVEIKSNLARQADEELKNMAEERELKIVEALFDEAMRDLASIDELQIVVKH